MQTFIPPQSFADVVIEEDMPTIEQATHYAQQMIELSLTDLPRFHNEYGSVWGIAVLAPDEYLDLVALKETTSLSAISKLKDRIEKLEVLSCHRSS